MSDRSLAHTATNGGDIFAHSVDRSVDGDSLRGVQYVQEMLFHIKATQGAFQEATRLTQTQHQRIKVEIAQQRHIARMQQFLESGDPILIAEAMAWAQVNPGVLQVIGLQLSLIPGSQAEQPDDPLGYPGCD